MTESQQSAPPIKPTDPLRPFFFVLLAIVGIGAVIAISKWRTPPELIPWQNDFKKAQADAATANKPILLYFTAEWCGPCQSMRRNVFSDAEVAAATARFVPVRIDVDRDPALAKQFNIEAMPTFFQLTADGRHGRTFVGAMESDQMIAWLGKPN